MGRHFLSAYFIIDLGGYVNIFCDVDLSLSSLIKFLNCIVYFEAVLVHEFNIATAAFS